MKVPFLDLSVPDAERAELLAAVDRVLQHGRIVMGPEVEEFESRVAQYCGRRFAVGLSSGSDALFMALLAAGIGPGDEVITTAKSFVATANAISMTGARPVFADIGDDLNIDPASVEALIGDATKAIVPVHFTGKLCRMPELEALADRHGLFLVEDGSQAFGASFGERRCGSFGRVAAISLNPMKVLAACGEAGVAVTDEPEIADTLRALRHNGIVEREYCRWVSLNGRLDTMQAAILLQRLEGYDALIERRRAIAARYDAALGNVVGVPREAEGYRDVYYTYTIRTERRDELAAFLADAGIETKIQHPLLMPQQPAYRDEARGAYPRAERLVKDVLCLPASEKLSAAQQDAVIEAMQRFFAKAS